MPVFIRYEELTGRTFRVFYDDKNPANVLAEEGILPGEPTEGPKDGSMGHRYVELVLNEIFGIADRK
jgi:hypothetical protein